MKQQARWSMVTSLLAVLTACGGGGGSASVSTSASPGSTSGVSTGAISAFGSVFVNKVEYSTAGASVVDDDTGARSASTMALEVGQVVDVKHAKAANASVEEASELHVHPLARGYVDVLGTGTLTVMGQTVSVTSATSVSDHRACVTAAVNPCAAISAISGLTATTGSGSAAVGGNYVVVDGYLFSATSGAATANIIATLVSVRDVPTSTLGANFKAEGPVAVVGSSAITIGGLAVNLASATCKVNGATSACASAFSVGNIVSVYAPTAPALPAAALTATVARSRTAFAAETPGTAVNLEGRVSSLGTNSFVLGGVAVDASALTTALPAVGDVVSVTGVLGGDGTTVVASAVTIVHAASSKNYGFEGDATAVTAGTAANTFTLTLLGETITVDSSTRLADRSTRTWDQHDAATNPFNITTFKTYLAASTSQHLVVLTQTDSSGTQIARSVKIVPAATTASVQGPVDMTPAVANSSATGTPTTFDVAGLSISADPAAIRPKGSNNAVGTITAGDQVVVRGQFTAGTITVTATRSATNLVQDFGVTSDHDLPCSF